MERRFLTGFIIFSLFVSSCSNPGLYIDVFSGNYAYSRGEYQDANLLYIKAFSKKSYSDFVSYNLGNVYYALGEAAPALTKWNFSVQSENPAVRFSSFFNRGVLLFELSRYEEAYNSFKSALKINPSDISTKIDLEYCLLKMNVRNNSSEQLIRKKEDEGNDKRDDAMRILDFIKRIERKSFSTGKGNVQSDEGEVNDW